VLRKNLFAVALALAAALAAAAISLAAAQSSSAALTGVVRSQEEPAMEGVLVGAKRTGSTITVTRGERRLWAL
jgi:hypothetical protein